MMLSKLLGVSSITPLGLGLEMTGGRDGSGLGVSLGVSFVFGLLLNPIVSTDLAALGGGSLLGNIGASSNADPGLEGNFGRTGSAGPASPLRSPQLGLADNLGDTSGLETTDPAASSKFPLLGLAGNLGAALGRGGTGGMALVAGNSLGSKGTVFADTKGAFSAFSAFSLAAVASLSLFVGGNGGRFACSSGGGNFLPSVDDVLVRVPYEVEDRAESEVAESFEPRRSETAVHAFRGGRAGEEALREGKGGGARGGSRGEVAFRVFSWSRPGGGSRFFAAMG